MKVTRAAAKRSGFLSVSNADERKASAKTEVSSFNNQINDNIKTNHANALTALADEVNTQGEIVCKRCDIKELKRYKELISEFLQEMVRFNFEFDKQSRFDGFGRFKVYANIKKINKNIEGLTESFLNGQKDPIDVLKKIDDIKGLILDMLL